MMMAIPEEASHDEAHGQSGATLKYDRETGTRAELSLGRGHLPGEAVFVPAEGAEHFVIMDAATLDDTPVASVELVRVPGGFHGSWIPVTVAGWR